MYKFKYGLIISLFSLLAFVFLAGCEQETKPAVDGDKLREYAGDLVNRALYKQAIETYEKYLDNYKIDDREKANVNYIIANTYFERLKDYENALTYYLKIKHLYPKSNLLDEVNKKVVACLERLERTEDAQQAMEEAVQLDPDQVTKKRPGEVVARIGDREITQGDLDFEISQLQPSLRAQFKTKDQKLKFLREYVATELLYNTAKRAGLDKNQQVIEGTFQAKKSLMVNKLLQQRIADKVEIDQDDIELYYQAHKDRYVEKDDEGNVIRQKSLDKVRQQVAQDLQMQKYQDAYQGLIEKMFMAEGVEFFENRVQ